jgi:2-polyprenyl-3-methyl-5-hydroxy-6-metoxy-1,4-benzoquinol methylase
MNLENSKSFLRVKDHSVSGEIFDLVYISELDMLSTFPKPEGQKLAAYYESEDYISHTDNKRSAFEKTYQFVKNLAIKSKLGLLEKLQPGKGKLLDIGCGTGDFLATAKKSTWQCIGIEPNQKARTIAASKGITLVGNTTELEDHSFDAICMWHVLEHVPDLDFQISELKRLLRPNGILFVAVPNFKSYDAKLYGEFWAAYDVPRHLWHFSKTAIKKLFEKHGMDLKAIAPMRFDAFYVSLLSEKYRTGSMNPLKAVINGLISNVKATKSKEFSSHIYIIMSL